ncbi:MAG: hypothetical protein JSV51_08580 [Candidatus Bathyarchaeota archaeon]|nr:MAG: hypothetical protein JSV51_08580 [Candidatus Bathyarchaeota archaeon]
MDIASISALVASIGVIIGVILTVVELRNLVKQRQTDLVMRLHARFGTREFIDAWENTLTREFDDYRKYVAEHGMSDVAIVGSFFEGIGLLLHRKLIDIDLVAELFRESSKMTWERARSIVRGQREQYNEPRWGEWWEYLYNELQKREQTLAQP